jgi:prolyl-tRNA synthetase
MKATKLFFKTRKESPKDADSINANVLVRGGYVQKHMAGVYGLLPLGLKVYRKIENIVREGMNSIDGQEIMMNVLQPRELWDETGRFSEISEIMYQFKDKNGKDIGLAPTHEEQVTDIIRHHIKSYKDLPTSLYQIQVKFRNEPRAKSGLLRGREFMMKDMYSFHVDEKDFENYYKKVGEKYLDIFSKIGLKTKYVAADGGIFSKYSHEFQVICPTGEDTIYYCDKCDFAENKEIAKVKNDDKCPKCDGKIIEAKSIEVGNIFPLKNKFSSAMGAKYVDNNGSEKDLIMGCYGIGLTRALAAIVEVYFDQENNMMIWPESVAPFDVEIISLEKNKEAEELYEKIKDKIDILYDDRDVSAGEKFAEADLIGAPKRVIVSEKSIKSGGAELIDLKSGESQIVEIEKIASVL